MVIQIGNIKYRGSFKSIRQYMNLHDPNSYAGEKGGANGDLIKNNPAFVRKRENMNEFNGCGLAVKAIRHGLLSLLPEQCDKYFSARLMSIVNCINLHDPDGIRGKRAIIFTNDRPLLCTIIFNKLEDSADMLKDQFSWEHPIGRAEATLSLTALAIKPIFIPAGATHYRVLNHVSIISDYIYNETNRRYEPLSQLNTKSAFIYSEYTLVGAPLTDDLAAAFPTGTTLTDDDTVIQVAGVEFYQKLGTDNYLPLKGGSMLVIDTF